MNSRIAEMGKIILESYERYWGFTTEIQKTIFQVLPPVELFKTARVSLCATPSQRVSSDSMHRCLCDSLYIGRYRILISILGQKPPRIDSFRIFAKL